MSVIEIIPNLYLSSCSVRFNKKQMSELTENTEKLIIIECLKDELEDPICSEKHIIYKIHVDDTSRPDNQQIFIDRTLEILSQVIDYYNKGNKILVHCSQGVQRSASFTCIILMKLFKIDMNSSIEYVLSKKPSVFAHGRQVNFSQALQIISQKVIQI